jgi:hypothetical protein
MDEMNPKSLREWWSQFMDESVKPKLRYIGWDHKVKYFTPISLDKKRNEVKGSLDSGEKMSYSLDSSFWVNYEEGMEDSPKAI